LPIAERWSAKNFTLDKIFNHDKIVIDSKFEIDEYYNLDSWDELKNFYKSELKLRKMPKTMVKPYYA